MHTDNLGGDHNLTISVFVVYLFPTIVAFLRRHHNAPAIAALNIMLGWTIVLWIAAFIWSLTYAKRSA